MGMVKKKMDFRVEVEPRNPGDLGVARMNIDQSDENWIADCEAIADQIRRHVDGLPSYGDKGVTVRWDEHPFCEHCGCDWTEGEDSPHNGGCCAKDADVLEAQEATAE